MNVSLPKRFKALGNDGLLFGIVSAAVLCGAGAAHSGPCTTQIAQVEQQISVTTPGPESGPMAPQTVGAQLHHQPTPGAVEHAERIANKDADAALDRARKADAANDAALCQAAITEARRLYDIK
jgi:hypothetical protein